MDYEELKEKMEEIKEQSDYHTQLLLTSAELAEESCEEHAKIAKTFDRLALVCDALASGLFIASCFTDLSALLGLLVLIVGVYLDFNSKLFYKEAEHAKFQQLMFVEISRINLEKELLKSAEKQTRKKKKVDNNKSI